MLILSRLIDLNYQKEIGLLVHNGNEEEYVGNIVSSPVTSLIGSVTLRKIRYNKTNFNIG